MGEYSQDLRERILKAVKEGAGDIETAKRYGVHRNTVWKYRKRWEENGEHSARKRGGKKPAKLAGQDQSLRQWTEENVNITTSELAAKCGEELGIKVAANTVWRRLKLLKLSHKKKSSGSRTRSPRRKGRP